MEQNESNLLVTEKSNDSTPLSEISNNGLYQNVLRRHIKEDPKQRMLDVHRLWMKTVQHEYPMPYVPYKIGVYIRYYNQTNHENYIEKHIEQFRDDIGLAEEESRIRSRSMESSLRMRLDHGLPLTPELLGFIKDDDGKLIKNPETYKIPKLMFYMYLYGYSTQQIADTLD